MSAVAALVPLMVLSESGFMTRNAAHFNGFEWMGGNEIRKSPHTLSHQTDTANSVYPALCAIAVVILGSLGEVGACFSRFVGYLIRSTYDVSQNVHLRYTSIPVYYSQHHLFKSAKPCQVV